MPWEARQAAPIAQSVRLVLPCGNNDEFSARYLCQGKEEEGGDAADTPADDDAALAQRAGVEFTGIPTR